MRQMRNDMTGRYGRVLTHDVLHRMEFPHTCDMWRPLAPAVDANKAAQDITYELHSRGQTCFFQATTETDEPTVMGRTNADNLFTLDRFLFPGGVPVADAWVLRFKTEGDNYNEYWIVRGNPQASNPHPFHPDTDQLVYATKIVVLPAGVGE